MFSGTSPSKGVLKRQSSSDRGTSRPRGISEDKIDTRARTISTVVRDSKRVDFIFDVLQVREGRVRRR